MLRLNQTQLYTYFQKEKHIQVYLAGEPYSRCITKHFEEDAPRRGLTRKCYEEVRIKKASPKAVMLYKAFFNFDELEKKVKACCQVLKKKSKLAIQKNSETSFMLKHLLPYLEEVFMVDPNMAAYMQRTVDGVGDSGFIPDWKLGYGRYKKKELFCFFVEVKRPGETSKYQKETDFVKLLKEMKSSIDKQVNIGLASSLSFGLLVEGFRCTLYMMRVEEEGIYVPKTVKRFSLMQDAEDAVNIPAIVESLLFVKEHLEKLESMHKNIDKEKPLKRLMKHSFLTEFK